MKKLENIYYTNMKLPQQILDVYLPDCDAFPVFIYFHGGGIESGDKTEPTFYNDLQQKGIAIVTANYRMYPSAVYPNLSYLCRTQLSAA